MKDRENRISFALTTKYCAHCDRRFNVFAPERLEDRICCACEEKLNVKRKEAPRSPDEMTADKPAHGRRRRKG